MAFLSLPFLILVAAVLGSVQFWAIIKLFGTGHREEATQGVRHITNTQGMGVSLDLTQVANGNMRMIVNLTATNSTDGQAADKNADGLGGRRVCDVLLDSAVGFSGAFPPTQKAVSYSLQSCDDKRLGNKLPLVYMIGAMVRSADASFSWKCLSRGKGTILFHLQELHEHESRATQNATSSTMRSLSATPFPTLQSVCTTCREDFPHQCPNFYLASDSIRHDLQAVLSTVVPTLPDPSDVAIHLRCGDLFEVANHGYGFLPHSSFVRLIKEEYGLDGTSGPSSRELNVSIGIVTQPFGSKKHTRKSEVRYGQRCRMIVNDLVKTLQSAFPASRIDIFNQPERMAIPRAWARLAKAKRMAICGPSTFALWPTLASKKAYVYKNPIQWPWIEELAQRWDSLEVYDSPLLSRYTGKDEDLPPPLSDLDVDDILQWLREH